MTRRSRIASHTREETMVKNLPSWRVTIAMAALIAGCSTPGDAPPRPAHPVEGVRKVVDSLAAEIRVRAGGDPFRNLPVVVRTANPANTGIEPIIAEFVRTRLVESGVPVEAVCAARCMEVSLQEFAIETPKASGFSPGQILIVAGANVPFVGGLIRTLAERDREEERAANRATGVFVTFAARDGTRYTARAHVVAIISAGEVAIEKQ